MSFKILTSRIKAFFFTKFASFFKFLLTVLVIIQAFLSLRGHKPPLGFDNKLLEIFCWTRINFQLLCCFLCLLTTCCPYRNSQVVSALQTTQSWHVREKTCLTNARKTLIRYLLGLPIMILPSTLTNVYLQVSEKCDSGLSIESNLIQKVDKTSDLGIEISSYLKWCIRVRTKLAKAQRSFDYLDIMCLTAYRTASSIIYILPVFCQFCFMVLKRGLLILAILDY